MPERNTHGPTSFGLHLQWVFANAISMAIGMGGTAMAIVKISSMGTLTWAIGLLGVLPGVAQAIVLRRHISRVGWWILATVGGFTLTLGPAALTYRASLFISERGVDKLISFLVFLTLVFVTVLFYGLATGALQWIVLRNQFARANRWIFVSTEGWALGITVGLILAVLLYIVLAVLTLIDQILHLLDLYYYADQAFAWMIGLAGAIVGVIAGVITGAELGRMLEGPTVNSEELIA